MKHKRQFAFYKPKVWLILMDAGLWFFSIFTIVFWRYVADKFEILNYVYYFLLLFIAWIAIGYVIGKYRSLRQSTYMRTIGQVFIDALLLIGAVILQFALHPIALSVWVIVMLLEFMSIYSIFLLLFYYGFRYALYVDEEYTCRNFPQCTDHLRVKSEMISDAALLQRQGLILAKYGDSTLAYLQSHFNLNRNTTLVLGTNAKANLEAIQPFTYDQIMNLMPLNQSRHLNELFYLASQSLPVGGLYMVCFKDETVNKQEILQRFPKGLNWFFYCIYFFCNRLCPKMLLTNRIYYDITRGKKRALSKTEVLGRLCYCGFEIVDECVVDGLSYVIARRQYETEVPQHHRYGVLIKLNRVGLNGKRFKVYKVRTMHPYSEYLQGYMYDKNQLQEGGKIKDDIRISTLGRFMRRCWLDEFPMFINLFKGDMKLVGVRPLSQHYFNLYSPELQLKRVKFKPGLLPPFYADMPKTLDEIQASEMRYLDTCEKKGVRRTDFVYFWLIVYNILIKHARSH